MIYWTWASKVPGLPYWTEIDFIIYWTWTNLKKLGLPYWTGIDFVTNWTWIEEINQPRRDAIRKACRHS